MAPSRRSPALSSTRRSFLYTSGGLALLPVAPACGDGESTITSAVPGFAHGVASGDPLADAVVIWTRITPESGEETIEVSWEIAADPELAEVVQSGTFATSAELDFTVKVDVSGLEAGTTYYYRFRAGRHTSPVGRTRTLPSGAVERLRFAVASCSNYPYGFFNAYRAIARRSDLDAVLHLGDYIYEYAEGQFGDGRALDRPVEPPHEIVSLEDYRRRHALYKTDPDLQEAHRQHPFIAVWDDHEVANDAYRDGAQNHDPETEGDYAVRKANAQRAYFEWMPVRAFESIDEGRIYRSFAFGELCDLTMLDTRHFGRDKPPAEACDPAVLNDPERQLLGEVQEDWFLGELADSQARGTRWRFVGQQVMFAQLRNPSSSEPCPLNVDQWDGYGASRARVLDAVEERGIDNVIVLTGDIHSSWAIDVSRDPFDPEVYDPETGQGSVAVELVTPSVTSPGIDDARTASTLALITLNTHPHIKYVDLSRRGYLLVDVTEERVLAEWYHVLTITERSPDEELAAVFAVQSGAPHLVAADEASEPRAGAPQPAP